MRLVGFVLFIAMGCAAAGCGPIGYFAQVRREARRAVDEARAASAEGLSPYEWTAALVYLERAQDLAGYSRWQDAITCGQRATTLARAAADRARKAQREVR